MKKVSSLSAAALTRRGLTMAAGSLVTGLLVGCSTSGQVGDSVVAEATPTPETVAGDTQLAAPGVTDDQILFGQSAAFTGPAEELGKNMEFGIRAAFHEVNQKGGVHGRELVLLIADDRYEPELAIANTRKLIEELGVFALIGAVGTPTSRSAVPVAFQAGVPYIAPFTGAEILRNPDLVNVINLRASYYQETEEMVKRLTTDLGVTRIGVLYQDDSYGRAGYNGVRRALEKRSMQMVSIGVYTRNTTAVKAALLDLRRGNPEAVIMIGAYQPVAALIKWARQIDMEAIFMTVSFVGSNALAEELGPDGEGVFVTQVVPFPTDRTIPVVKDYFNATRDLSSWHDPGFVSLEGYLAGRLAIAALEHCVPDPTRQCFLESVRNLGLIDLGGFKLNYEGMNDNQGSDEVFLTMIDSNGNYQSVSTLRDVQP
ncbi:MAG: ABC transporter substrate-binding protein [Chloroflexota bacterium]|nr:ABC transporter substrate-binding protein [Chloroflexota bacterium]